MKRPPKAKKIPAPSVSLTQDLTLVLHQYILGTRELSTSQVNAALGLLRLAQAHDKRTAADSGRLAHERALEHLDGLMDESS